MFDNHEEFHRKLDNYPSFETQNSIAILGDHTHRDRLLNSNNPIVLANVARHGNDKHREQLIDDPDFRVRSAVARTTTNINHIDKLLNDNLGVVRSAAVTNPIVTDVHRRKYWNDLRSQTSDTGWADHPAMAHVANHAGKELANDIYNSVNHRVHSDAVQGLMMNTHTSKRFMLNPNPYLRTNYAYENPQYRHLMKDDPDHFVKHVANSHD